MKQPALHATIRTCGTKSAQIAPPNTLTDSYTRFAKNPTLSQFTASDTQIRTLYYYITEVDPVSIHWLVVYAILLLCWSTACFFNC